MAPSPNRAIYIRLVLLFLLVVLLGLAPRAHQEQQELALALQAQESGDPAAAARHLALAAAQSPWRADLWEQAGAQALQAGEHRAARHYLEHAGRVHTALSSQLSVPGRLDLGEAYQGTGDLPAAIQTWEQAIAAGAPPRQTGWRIAQAQRALGQFSAALTTLNELNEDYPDDAQLYYEIGLISSVNDPQAALEPLAHAAELDADLEASVETLRRNILTARISEEPAYALASVGQALAALGHWDLAAEACYQATLQNPDYAEAWAFLGGARHMLQAAGSNISQAASAQGDGWAEIQTALELDPESLSAINFSVIYWLGQDHTDLALQSAQRAAELYPDEPDLQVQLGNLLAANGELDAADQAYQQAVLLAPYEPIYLQAQIQFSLKYSYQITQVALPAARQALSNAPNDPLTLDLMAQVLLRLGDLATARRFVAQALEIDPKDAAAHLNLALIYIYEGDQEAGYQELILAESLADEGPLAEQIQRHLMNLFPQDQ